MSEPKQVGNRRAVPVEDLGHLFDRIPEAVVHPLHYGGDTVYEVFKVIDAWGLGFYLGNALKYIARAGKKDPTKEIEDLKKAAFYIEHQILLLGGAVEEREQPAAVATFEDVAMWLESGHGTGVKGNSIIAARIREQFGKKNPGMGYSK